MKRSSVLLVCLGLVAVGPTSVLGCGGAAGLDDAGPPDVGLDGGPDAAAAPDAGSDAGPPDAPFDGGPVCGDGEAGPGEACDDGNRLPDDGCSPGCALECGDGRVSGDELCDPAIASGAGSCPASCDDGLACTTDTLTGAGCSAACVATEITVSRDDDGCCPTGASSLVDRDCPVVCGNGLFELGELCDTAIARGVGSCPSRCDDGAVCTADVLVDGGSCTAACVSTPITLPAGGDGCCPLGATLATDSDCSPACGDGVLSSGEVCDTGIASGDAGSCPAACDDGMVCTRDVLTGEGSCGATCTFTILPPTAGDGCCPPGATIATDDDCAPRCGDGVWTAPEACDDGNVATGDGCGPSCEREPLAFRLATISFQDPRLFNGSLDVTPEVNGAVRTALTGDSSPMDGFVDLSIVIFFDPLDQAAASTPVAVATAQCTMPLASTVCTSIGSELGTAVNASAGTCLGPIADTIPMGRIVSTPTAPCFSAALSNVLELGVGGAVVPLRYTQLGAQYVGDPARQLATGLIRGFLTEADALAARIGDRDLTTVLRASHRDVFEGVPGWWLYLGFTASPVAYTP